MRLRLHAVHLRLLPLAVAAILIVTAVPIEIGAPVAWDWDLRGGDFIANIVLFAPLGFALWRRPLWAIVAIALLASTAIEVSQMWSIDRFSSAYDVLANTVGALVGALAWRLGRSRSAEWSDVVTVGAGTAAALTLIAAGIVFQWWRPATSSALFGWDRTYPLQLGNELTGDREWHGVISALAIVPSALSRRELGELSRAQTEVWPSLIENAIDVSVTPRVLSGGSSLQLPADVAEAFVDRATQANAFTIAARIRSASLAQDGPARIVSFSIDPYHRNVDLGQEFDTLMFRVRTPVTGENGQDNALRSTRSLRADTMVTIAGTYDGAVERLWIDGALVGRLNVAALGCRMSILCGEAEHEAWSSLGGIIALIGLVIFGTRRRVLWLSAAAGALIPLALYAVHPDPARIASQPWTPLLAGVMALVVAASASKNKSQTWRT